MRLEIAVCDDASTDNTLELLKKWEGKLNELSISLNIFKNETSYPKGGDSLISYSIKNIIIYIETFILYF